MTSQAMTRRAALGAIASVPAIAGAVAAPVLLEKEIPVQKVNRLAAELSEAMDEWMVDISHPDYQRALWVAHVWPSSSGHGIYFKNEGDAVKPTPQQRLDAAIAELKAAAEALDPNIYQWNINTNEDKRCGLLVAAFRTTTKYEGDGWYESPWEWGEVKQALVRRAPEHDRNGQRWFRITPYPATTNRGTVLMDEHNLCINYGRKIA
ncbi:MAG: hypothetical protein EOR60_09655 [Mesorhizobium sp.]|nr:MAG: hypothetical protein EOR60_09655 [Mesorhizobium sp.]